MTEQAFRISQPLVMLMSAFDHSGSVDPVGMSTLARHVASAGLSNFMIAGVVGELHDTDSAERHVLLAAVRSSLRDIPRKRIYVGVPVGAGVVEEAEHHRKLGADAVMLFHGQGPSAGAELVGACSALDSNRIPFLIDYDGKSIEVVELARCTSFRSLIGIKCGSASRQGWRRLRDSIRPDLPLIFGGGDDLAPQFDGASAFTSTTANVVPALMRHLARDLEPSVSKVPGAKEPDFAELRPWAQLRSSRPSYAAAVTKCALGARAMSVGEVRARENRFRIEDTDELLAVVHELVAKELAVLSATRACRTHTHSPWVPPTVGSGS